MIGRGILSVKASIFKTKNMNTFTKITLVLIPVLAIGGGILFYLTQSSMPSKPSAGFVTEQRPGLPPKGQKSPMPIPSAPEKGMATANQDQKIPTKTAEIPSKTEQKSLDDSASTLSNPIKVATIDGKQYFLVGQPKGQNSKQPRKIIFSLPGHGSTAEQDFSAWKSHIVADGTYALASVNWWDGEGEKTSDYYRPDEVLANIKGFLDTYGYTADDFVVLEGFSRGSANTYPVKAYDMVSGTPIIDAVISASGKYQSDFPLTPKQSEYQGGKLYQNVPWILVCGAKDDNPTRDGCIGMNETKTYLESTGANVLALLEDPNGGHGAFHQSPLGLVKKALALLNALPVAR